MKTREGQIKQRQLCRDFLRARRGQEFEAIQAASAMYSEWGIKVDWHEMSDALESLVRDNEAARCGTGPDRLTVYRIKQDHITNLEHGLYDALKDSPLRTELRNYHQAGSKRKWVSVGYFVQEPRHSPSSSNEMVEVAKFTHEGDAHLYANLLARRPDAIAWWAVAVR